MMSPTARVVMYFACQGINPRTYHCFRQEDMVGSVVSTGLGCGLVHLDHVYVC